MLILANWILISIIGKLNFQRSKLLRVVMGGITVIGKYLDKSDA